MVGFTTEEVALMRADFTAVNLLMRAHIQRFVISGQDIDGHPTGSYQDLYTELPCWYWEMDRWRSSIEEVTGPNINAQVSYPRLLIPAGTDINIRDKVVAITGFTADGTTVVNLNVRTILHRLYNILLTLEADK